jgi:UDP-N-acetylglucosamine 3-dehydrogenase
LVGIALIGTGYWGKNHARNWQELLEEGIIDHLTLCDTDIEKVKALVKDGDGIEYTTDYREVLKSPHVDAVDIVTPSHTHHAIAKECLEQGKDVLIEKPMTIKASEARDLVRTAEEHGNILMVGHLFRYHPGIIEVKKRIEHGEFGEIYYMNTNRTAFSPPRPDMGVLYALGVHEVDLYCYLLGIDYPKSITAHTGSFLRPGIEEVAGIAMELTDTTVGYAFESWISPFSKKVRNFSLIGSKRSILVDYLKPQEISLFDGTIAAYDREGGQVLDFTDEGVTELIIPYNEPLRLELMDFVFCSRTRAQPVADMYAGLRAVEMIEACVNRGRFP